MLERITGHKPHTCPWRAYYHPLVREIVSVAWALDEGNLGSVLTPEAPAVLVDGVGVFRLALQSVLNEEARLREEARKRGEKA